MRTALHKTVVNIIQCMITIWQIKYFPFEQIYLVPRQDSTSIQTKKENPISKKVNVTFLCEE